MAWIVARGSVLGRVISKSETKVCPLCGTLNHSRNKACFACEWRGAFEADAAATDYRWQRLLDRYEEVRLEHVVAGAVPAIGESGKPRRISAWQRLSVALAQHWAALLSRRAIRLAAAQAASRPKSTMPPA